MPKPNQIEENNAIAKVLDAVYVHGKETPNQSRDLPEGQLTIAEGLGKIQDLISIARRERYEKGLDEKFSDIDFKGTRETIRQEAIHLILTSVMEEVKTELEKEKIEGGLIQELEEREYQANPVVINIAVENCQKRVRAIIQKYLTNLKIL